MDPADGQAAAQDPGGLPLLPRRHPRRAAGTAAHAVITGERRAAKVACVVRAGGRRKRTRTAGTSPAAHQHPAAQPRRGRREGGRPAPAAPGRRGQRAPARRRRPGRHRDHARARTRRLDRCPNPPPARRGVPAPRRWPQPGRDRRRAGPVPQHRAPVRPRRRPRRAPRPRPGTPRRQHLARLRALPAGTAELRLHQRHNAVAGDPRPRLPGRLPRRPGTTSRVSAETPSCPPPRRNRPSPRSHRLDHDQARRPRPRRPGQPGRHRSQLPGTSRPHHAGAGVRHHDDRTARPRDPSRG